jgi:hypothetical protein
MKLTTKIIAGLILLVGGLILVRIVLSNMFSIDGIALSQMNTQISSLDRENMLLKEKIYTASSYTTIASDAATMGFVEEKSQISLSNASSIAIRQ